MVNFFLFSALSCLAAEPRWTPVDDKTLSLRAALIGPGLDFTVSGPGADIVYVPNSPTLLSFGVGYQNVGFSFQLPSSPDAASIEEKGTSTIQDYQLRFFGHRDTHELIYQDFKGYSIQDWKDALTGQPQLRPDMRVQTVGYNYITVLSPAYFSNAVAFAQSGFQKEGGGSFLLWTSAGRTNIKSDSPMLPSSITSGRSRIHDLISLQTHYLLGGFGYGYTLPIWTHYYFVGSAYLGAGVGYQKAEVIDNSGKWSNSSLHRVGLRLGTGYNYNNHAVGIQIIVDQNSTTVEDGQVSQATFSTQVYYSHRIGDVDIPIPSFLK